MALSREVAQVLQQILFAQPLGTLVTPDGAQIAPEIAAAVIELHAAVSDPEVTV